MKNSNRNLPPLYFALSQKIERGTHFYVQESFLSHEFIVLNPDDFEQIQTTFKPRQLVRVKNEMPFIAWASLIGERRISVPEFPG